MNKFHLQAKLQSMESMDANFKPQWNMGKYIANNPLKKTLNHDFPRVKPIKSRLFIGCSSHVSETPRSMAVRGILSCSWRPRRWTRSGMNFTWFFLGFSESWMGNSWDLHRFTVYSVGLTAWHRRWESLLFFEEWLVIRLLVHLNLGDPYFGTPAMTQETFMLAV